MTIKTDMLSNGVRIVTDAFASELVAISITVEIGTRHEDPELNGLAHFLEHMAFKGTLKRTQQEIAAEIEGRGGWMNAGTGKDLTKYYAGVLKEDAMMALDVLGDITQNAVIDEEEFERERNVIRQEMRDIEDSPMEFLGDKMMATAFTGGLALPGLGTPETLANARPQNLSAFILDHYCGMKTIVAAAGGVDHEELVESADLIFLEMPAIGEMPFEPVAGVSKYRGGRFAHETDGEQVHLILTFPSFPLGHAGLYSDMVFGKMIGGCTSSRLWQEIREKRGLAYEVSFTGQAWREAGINGIVMSCGADDAPEAIRVLCEELKRARDGLTDDELRMGRKLMRAKVVMGLETCEDRLSAAQHHLAIHGKAYDMAEELALFEAVDHGTIRRCVEQMMSAPPTVAIRGPRRICDLNIEALLK